MVTVFCIMAQVIVPSTTCLYAMTIYLVAGTVMFAEWEGWNYLDSLYFCFTSLAKIGFGDLVAGASMHLYTEDDGAAAEDLKGATVIHSDRGDTYLSTLNLFHINRAIKAGLS